MKTSMLGAILMWVSGLAFWGLVIKVLIVSLQAGAFVFTGSDWVWLIAVPVGLVLGLALTFGGIGAEMSRDFPARGRRRR